MKKMFVLLICVFVFASCTIYTEKRSEALSQAVFATASSISNARFDFAARYSEQAKSLAYAPKHPINVSPIITSNVKQVESINNTTNLSSSNKKQPTTVKSNIITTTFDNNESEKTLRLVVPDFLKHAKILIENSEEWNELIKTKEIKNQLEVDNANLKKLAQDIDDELAKQQRYNNKMIEDLNVMQTQLAKKDLHILKLYITITILISAICGGIYLRIKRIL